MSAGLVGTSGFAAIPTTALDLPLVQRLRRSPRLRVRVPIDEDLRAPSDLIESRKPFPDAERI